MLVSTLYPTGMAGAGTLLDGGGNRSSSEGNWLWGVALEVGEELEKG